MYKRGIFFLIETKNRKFFIVTFQYVWKNGEKFESMAHSKRISHHLDATLQSLFVFFGDIFIVEKSLVVN